MMMVGEGNGELRTFQWEKSLVSGQLVHATEVLLLLTPMDDRTSFPMRQGDE